MPTHLQAKHTPAPTAAPAASQFTARPFEEETELVEEQAPEPKELAGGADTPPPSEPTPPPAEGGSAPPPGDGISPSSSFSFLDMPLSAEDAGVQAKLTIGEPGDKYEREADQTAAQVMRMPDPQMEDPLKAEEPLETETAAPQIQQKGKGGKPNSMTNLQGRLNRQSGKGAPLPKTVQSFMEPRFGQDFSGVRVHTDSSAVQMNKELGAQAFTHGRDIYFNQGKYSPGSSGGRELLAHELTHTIQQTGGIRAKSLSRGTATGNKIQAKMDISAAMPGIQMREGAAPAPTPAPAEPQRVKPQPDQGEAAPEAKPRQASVSPEQDPGFVAVKAKAKTTAEEKKQHKPASTESHDAQGAAESPPEEVESIAQDQHIGEMQQEEPGSFDAEAFKQDVLEKVGGLIPDTEEAAEDFPDNNELNTVRDDLSSDVEEEQEEAAGPIEEANEEDPDTSAVDARESDPMENMPPGSAPGDLGAGEAAPKPKPDSEVSDPIEEESQSIDQKMDEADVTEEQLANSNEPEFTAALDEKQKAEENAEQAPGEYREGEAATLNQAEAEACSVAASQTQGMQDSRAGAVSELTGLKGDAKGKDEGKRQEIADHINGIYERVKGEVETALNDLDTQVMDDFDAATDEAKRLFEDYVDREMREYRRNRYGTEARDKSGRLVERGADLIGLGDSRGAELAEEGATNLGAGMIGVNRWLDDEINGMPPEFNQIFADGKTIYMNHMSTALTDIANLVTDTLNEAKQKIADGKQEISDYVASLPSDLQSIGQEAADNIQSKFNDLEQQVNDKRDELVTKLADKYAENLEALDERIAQLEAENSGLINRALDAMGGVIGKILEIKAMLERIFAGAQGVIESILKDPIGFLDNLITGLTQGFNNFLGNIVTHLQSGLIGWLTGTLGSVGITMPEDIFSLEGIFSLTTQALGLTWDYVRSKAVRMFGEPAVSGMEQGSELFMTLKHDGPAGMWEQVKDQFTDLKQTVMDEIQNMLITEVIRAGIKWVLGLLTPATAFIKAGMMIFDIIMFFIENGQQIMALVESIIASVSAVANGDTNQMAVSVEDSLATALPVAIGFLASLLGLGGLTKRVRRFFEAIRERIDAAIEWVLEKAKRAASKLLKKSGLRGEANEKGEEPEHDAKVNEGLEQLNQEQNKFLIEGNKITQEDAERVAAKVKKDNPVFKSITVISREGRWDYKYVASNGFQQGAQQATPHDFRRLAERLKQEVIRTKARIQTTKGKKPPHDIAKKNLVIAVGISDQGNMYASINHSSSGSFREILKNISMHRGITFVWASNKDGDYHAEDILLAGVRSKGEQVEHWDVSSSFCLDCEEITKQEGISSHTNSRGQRTNNRKKKTKRIEFLGGLKNLEEKRRQEEV
ncbi:DUF4157 domain-containing protein [Nodosilinea sp. LEGE 07088]|nr:DUF4157 domain-containing protein [Nodosilinea sp. LEGE 07088]MBE9141338.1 DUF4157 domain-containing protein [Nodosilinea sp. LEGE 07088]